MELRYWCASRCCYGTILSLARKLTSLANIFSLLLLYPAGLDSSGGNTPIVSPAAYKSAGCNADAKDTCGALPGGGGGSGCGSEHYLANYRLVLGESCSD